MLLPRPTRPRQSRFSKALPIDVVLLEYKCDGFDAEAVAYQVKCRFPSQPIVLISAYPEIPDRTLWLVDDYLMNSQLDLLPVSIARVMHEKQKVHGGVEYSGQQRRPAGSDRPTSDRVKEIA
jgi:hypothetical protein